MSRDDSDLTMTWEKHFASPTLLTARAVYSPLSSGTALFTVRVIFPSPLLSHCEQTSTIRLTASRYCYWYCLRTKSEEKVAGYRPPRDGYE